ncbi:acetyl/propionyl/methylcrotonyl-CoA carboxylase subunit alpha [Nocardioides phosphati]|nr:biotin carboxylase N-terminal domain-containing protein [Nocardioides phosphati]
MDTLLIANRGEIARRVIRTARTLGIRTIAVFTEADAGALHVREADHAVQLPGYLDMASIIAAATDNSTPSSTGVHPGYGFLSENAAFARAVEEAGLAWVGPQPEVIDAMGRKDRARAIAEAAGVPVVPAYTLEDDPATFAYPVLVKAAAGGGGKGMRVVRSAADLQAAQEAAAREAAKAFGDDTLLLEKYVERGRHIEVQVFGDSHGNVVHLFERDCSTQRRHQKVLEEAPAPTLTDAQRRDITDAAVALAQHAGYTGAGTVEFLLDEATGEAYFLEMNTRLQVEHPVTEEVIRVNGERADLVELQLRISAGEPLGFTQDDVTTEGHAIEARVYAEDAWGGFLPQAGHAAYVSWPDWNGARVDHALESGQEVTTGFDPMLGKVIAVGADREQARQRLVHALEDTLVLGLTTNTGFLRELVASDAFRDAAIDTAWLDRTTLEPPATDAAAILAALAESSFDLPATSTPLSHDGWRDGGAAAPLRPVLADTPALRLLGPARVETAGGAAVTWGEELREPLAPGVEVVHAAVDGEWLYGVVRRDRRGAEVVVAGQRTLFARHTADRDHTAHAGDGSVLAPMPGTVLAVRVEAGQQVTKGDVLGVLEAMKMELSLTAPFDGTVTEVACATGAQVALGAVLFTVDGAESPA